MSNLLTGSDDEFEKATHIWAAGDGVAYCNAFGQSALHLAVVSPTRLWKLLELGADPNAIDRSGTTPLMYAATYGQFESVLALIEHGSCMDVQDTRNRRCFSDYALLYGHLGLIERLVDWLRQQDGSEIALYVLDRCIGWTLTQSSLWSDSEALDRLLTLGDSDVMIGSRTSMHLARNVEDARRVLRHGFTAVEPVDNNGETAVMRVARFLDPRLLRALLDLEKAEDLSIDRRDLTGWTALMHIMIHMNKSDCSWTHEYQQSTRASAISCLNILLSRGADFTVTDGCSCPCSPDGCSALSIALHQAIESLSPYHRSESISQTPVDFAIAVQTSMGKHPQLAADTTKTFVDFLETGKLHTCCARRRVRSPLWPIPSDCSDTSNARANVRLISSAAMEPLGGLVFQLARLYDALGHRSQMQHDERLAARIKGRLVHEKQPRVSGLVVDTVRDCYERNIRVDSWVPEVRQLDTGAYRGWIAWCVEQKRQMHSRRSLETWSEQASAFVDGLSKELDKLKERS